jgi:protein-disulfide isomerase
MDEQAQIGEDLEHVEESRSTWFIPVAIVIAGVILAGTIYFVRTSNVLGTPQGDLSALQPISASDHIIGNPTAPVIVIEYGDVDSSYVKSFQATMEQIMTDYGAGGKVAWVYRHFPLIDQHQYSESHAEAAECAASLGSANTFWRFIDLLQSQAPDSQEFDPKGYDAVVKTLGIDTTKFDACMTSHVFQTRVEADISNAIAIGAESAPYSVILIHGQKSVPVDGALPYDSMKKVLDQAISQAK